MSKIVGNQLIGMTAQEAMLAGLTDRIRRALRARIMERIEPDIQLAVDEAIHGLKSAIESYAEPLSMSVVVNVLIDGVRKEVK